ncbi:MAG: alpha/beta hydrolase [Clostridia bacterium]|nr:alpha/beta hydrolase [Clostridia bacterium]
MQFFTHEITLNGYRAPLRCYIPDAAPHARYQTDRPAVIVFPGGGYKMTYGGEAEPIALQYLAAGACAFVLDYSVFPAHFPQALLEGLTAIRFVRDHAEEYGIAPKKIAVCGFSAGGHLAASTGTFWNEPCLDGLLEGDRARYRPDKMILCYPVTTYKSHGGSFQNLLAGNEEELTPEMTTFLSVNNRVDDETPPAYIWHNCDDKSVAVGESFLFAKELCDHNVPVEMRVYPSGGHGVCLGNYITKEQDFGDDKPCAGWVGDTLPFLFR